MNITANEINQINKGAIKDYLQNCLCKFVFLNLEYNVMSSFNDITEIHKFKSRFHKNSHVCLPLSVVNGDNGKYNVIITNNENLADGYVLISKNDILKQNPSIKRNPQMRIELGKHICTKCVAELNKILTSDLK